MPITTSAPWHAESYLSLLNDTLPRLLAERLPLASYRAVPNDDTTIKVVVELSGGIELAFELPLPDSRGVFRVHGGQIIVIPVASSAELDTAELRCVGEQLFDLIAERLGEAPRHLAWDAALARAWLPLDTWVREFLTPYPDDFGVRVSTAQWLDQTNWLAIATHIRRVVILRPERLMAPGQIGRVCPFEIPEGPNLGRIFVVAVGATIRDRRLVILDARPTATLGLSASCVPLIEHNEYARLLMGANMMRQWMTPPDPEPALVQSGEEPTDPAFWCGRNLLTAYITWDADAFEDGIVVSESAARRLGYPQPAEPGDKLSNRHGTKGVISRILPDAAMPHLADGTPVELIYSFCGLPSRLNFGQVREAVLSRIARVEGQPVVVPPFAAPSADEIHARLQQAGLPASGMEQLTLGRAGPQLEQASTVGWVYWGKLYHTAVSKIHVFTGTEGMERLVREPFDTADQLSTPPLAGQRQAELDYYALRASGAVETIREQYNTRSSARPDAPTLASRIAHGLIEQAGPPTPMFQSLVDRLRIAGIQATLDEGQLSFRFSEPEGEVLRLARPIAHPWLHERTLDIIGLRPGLPEHAPLVEANQRLAGMIERGGPSALLARAQAQLEAAVTGLFDALVRPAQLSFDQRTIFSARAVAAPGGMLRYDQVGLPDAIAWGLFSPAVARALGDADAVERRSEQAAAALDEVMAGSWVLIGRAPSLQPEAFLAFRPVRSDGNVIRTPALACNLLNQDYDGDMVAAFLPVTEAGQREAAERLTVAAHLTRDPGLIGEPRPRMDALLALAHLSLTEAGSREIEQAAGMPVPQPDRFLTRWSLADLLGKVLAEDGAVAALDLSERLAALGFSTARQLGLSLSPFVGEGWPMPIAPAGDDPADWERYADEVIDRYAAEQDHASDVGNVILAARSGARGNARLFAALVGARGAATDITGRRVALPHNNRDGLTLDELLAIVAESRTALFDLNHEWERSVETLRAKYAPSSYTVLARAMRSKRPGLAFALAAHHGETDPLHEMNSRLFVGL